MELRRCPWSPRPCDVCGERTGLVELGTRRLESHVRGAGFEFAHRDVACGRCGFVFSGEVPEAAFLFEYYALAHLLDSAFTTVGANYDAEARLEVLGRFVPPGARVVEIGAGTGAFCRTLTERGYLASGIDPLDSGSPDTVLQGGIGGPDPRGPSGEQVDAAVSYFVLEHVRSPSDWIREVRGLLRPRGVLVVSVPDFSKAPEVSLNTEHLSHFTLPHLEALFLGAGFELLGEAPLPVCRSYGFTVAGRLTTARPGPRPPAAGPELLARSRAAYLRARGHEGQEALRLRALAEELVGRLANAGTGASLVVWGASVLATRLAAQLEGLGIRDLALVDNSRTRIGTHHPGFRDPIQEPQFPRQAAGRRIFLACTQSWNAEIRAQILGLGLEDVEVVDATAWRPA